MIVDDRECMLRELQALDFKLYDLQLYLDTHPFDKDMLWSSIFVTLQS